ncbi:MAG TPA: hypothetical protein VNJ70_14480 [Thermoanaerobaculia bacterium]|nr:hypothetical protein [Thermoanaerobaculia bacterium]
MQSTGDRLKTWRGLFEGLKAHPEEAAFLGQEQAELGRYIQELDDLLYQANKQEAGLREAMRRKREVEGLVAELYGRIAYALRGRYGKRNPLLHGFSIEPHAERGARKREKEEKEKPAETPAEAPPEAG